MRAERSIRQSTVPRGGPNPFRSVPPAEEDDGIHHRPTFRVMEASSAFGEGDRDRGVEDREILRHGDITHVRANQSVAVRRDKGLMTCVLQQHRCMCVSPVAQRGPNAGRRDRVSKLPACAVTVWGLAIFRKSHLSRLDGQAIEQIVRATPASSRRPGKRQSHMRLATVAQQLTFRAHSTLQPLETRTGTIVRTARAWPAPSGWGQRRAEWLLGYQVTAVCRR